MDWRVMDTQPERRGVGLMSGTSCDGIDAAVVRFSGRPPELRVALEHFQTTAYPRAFRERLLAPEPSVADLTLLDFELGRRLGEAAAAAIDAARRDGRRVDFVASHGHTMAHLPPGPGREGAGTLQIGQPAVIAELAGVPVVADFRPRDMAAGGQGAPLVPYADWLLFHRPGRTVAALNIGGIANFSVLPPEADAVTAFDTGPGNMLIDGAMRWLTGGRTDMDRDGAAAARGRVDTGLLGVWLDHPFFRAAPPKSTGRETFGPEAYLRPALDRRGGLAPDDIVATATETVARSIAQAFVEFVAPRGAAEIIAAGGGTANPTLMRRLAALLPGARFRSTAEFGIPPAAREAVAFAVLGHETLCGRPSNAPRATGARRPVILGSVTFP